MTIKTISTDVLPDGQLDVLSKTEINKLLDASQGGLYKQYRKCSLAVLNTGNESDDVKELLRQYASFDISLIQEERGIKLRLSNAPASAFVDGVMIKGIRQHLYAIVRDIIYTSNEITNNHNFDTDSSVGTTDAVFHILRNARVLKATDLPKLVVCWGGHSISREEYVYSKEVGYELGLRGLDICTGCGPGAMKGPMKGAAIGHAKQHFRDCNYIGYSEPGIITAETPNPIVNHLVVFPDIEKRLEAFVRTGHATVVFPGGVGTTEEILYLLGILSHPDNKDMPFPLIFTGPASAAAYFHEIDNFIQSTLGKSAQDYYQIVIDDPKQVARKVVKGINDVREFRNDKDDAYYFNWVMKINPELQRPFVPTHENVQALALHKEQEQYLLAANLRRAFSAIVAGNVKEEGIRSIEENGLFELHGDATLMHSMDKLLLSFCEQKRMRQPKLGYQPCYRITSNNIN
jgi:pyrimidine/purine-5'-nucleotide nucleosidase